MAEIKKVEEDIQIPANIGVRCPKKGFKYRPLRRCEGCEFFQGLNIRMQRDEGQEEMPFDQKYECSCAFPIGRQLFEFDFTEE